MPNGRDLNVGMISPQVLSEESFDEEVVPLSPEDFASLEPVQVTGKNETAIRSGQAALIKDEPNNTQVLSIGMQEANGREAVRQAAAAYYDEVERQNDAYLLGVQETAVSVDAMKEYLMAGMNQRQQLADNRNSPTMPEKAVVEQQAVNVDEERKKEVEFRLAARNEIAAMMDSQGTFDKVLDTLGIFLLPFGDVKDILDAKEKTALSDALDDVFTGDSIEGMVTHFQSLSPERKQAIWPELQKAVLEATGTEFAGIGFSDKNIQRAAGILLTFLEPSGGDKLQNQATLDSVFGVAEVIPAGSIAKLSKLSKFTKVNMEKVMANAASTATRKNNSVKLVSELGNPRKAAEVNVNAMMDDTVAKTAGMTRQQAMDNALPTNSTAFNPEKATGLDTEIAQTINDFQRRAQGFTRSMTEESELLQIGALDKSDRKRVVKNFIQEMERKGEDLVQEGIHMSKMRITRIDEQGFDFEFELLNTKMQQTKVLKRKKGRPFQKGMRGEAIVRTTVAPVSKQGRMSWKLNQNTGHFGETVDDLVRFNGSALGRSPAAWSKVGSEQLDFGNSVKQAIQLQEVAVAAQSRINDLWLDANKTVTGIGMTKQRKLLEAVEIKGDEFLNPDTQARGKVFNVQELHAMGMTNPRTVEAYYKRRVVADQLHAMQNFATRRELELGGFGQTRIMGQEVLAKMFDTSSAALSSLANKRGFKIFMQDTREIVDWSADFVAEQYAKGKRLVRTRDDFNTTGAGDMAKAGERVEYVFINDATRLRQLPEQVLHYHPGYVPKINEGVEFVLRQKVPYAKAGKPDAHRSVALRAFASERELRVFRERLVEDELLKLNMVNKSPSDVERVRKAIDSQYEVADGSVMSQVERMENTLSSSEGLFVGTRAKGDMVLGLRGEEIERMNPSEAFGRYFQHLGQTISMNEWRVGQQQKWLNTVKQYQTQLGGADVRGFANTQLTGDTAVSKSLNQVREQITAWSGTPTREETLYQAMVQNVHDWTLFGLQKGMGLDKSQVASILYLKHANPVNALKAAVMHTFLGSMNFAQLYVQASAATVGLSLLRIADVPKTILRGFNFHTLDNIQDATALGKVYKMMKADGIIDQDAIDLHKLWQRTGLRESIRSNADMDIMASTGLGVTRDVLRKAGNVSLHFYRSGELMNRRLSFLSAAERYLQRTGRKVSSLKDADLSEILVDANKTMLELNSANKAWWQGGANTGFARQTLGLATQFMQVTTKTMELIAKNEARGGFTGAQKGRIALGQLALFGAAGVPLVNAVAPSLFDWVGAEPTPQMANAVNQGAMGIFVQEFLGADVDVSNRAALGGQIFQTVKDVVMNDDPLWLLAFGVSAETGARTFKILKELEPLFLADNRSMEDLTTAQLREAITTIFTELPSAGRNLMKSYILHRHHRTLDRRGRVVTDEDRNLATEIAVGLGFRLTDETRTRMLQLDNRDYDMLVREYADTIIDMHHDWVYKYDRDEEHGKVLLRKRQYLLETIDDPEMIRRVNQQVERAVFKEPVSLKQREMKKFWERTAADEITEGVMLDAGIIDSTFSREQAVIQPFAGVVDEENE